MTFFIHKDTRCQLLRRMLESSRGESTEAAEILEHLKNPKLLEETSNEKQQKD